MQPLRFIARFGLPLFLCALVAGLFGSDTAYAQEGDAEQIAPDVRGLIVQLNEKGRGADAVASLMALRDPRVKLLFERLGDRDLYLYEGMPVFAADAVTDESGQSVVPLYDPLEVDAPILADGVPVTVSPKYLKDRKNRLQGSRDARRAAKAALSVIDLMVDDPTVRLAAAKKVGDVRDASTLPRLREMARGDESARVRRVAAESIALIVASGGDPEAAPNDRLQAVEHLGELASIRGESMLREQRRAIFDEGADAATLATYDAALGAIESHKTRTQYIKYAFDGLSLGSILVLVGLGLAITFGLMGVINMAHGEMVMVGAVTTWACFEFVSPILPEAWFNWYYVLALPLSFLIAALVGWMTEIAIVRFLYKRPLDSLLATIGVGFILIQAVRSWKGDNLGMRRPSWFTGGWEIMQDVTLPYARLYIIALTAVCIIGVWSLFRFTRIGLMIRATVQNREMAESLGVNTRLVDMFTFAFGAGLAGIAGYAIFLISNVTPQMGQLLIVDSFLVVVVGGVGKLIGVIVSGLGLGVLQKFLEPMVFIEEPLRIFDATWAKVAVLMLVILFIQRRPSGLFPDKGRMADQADTADADKTGTSKRTDTVLGLLLVLVGLVFVPALYAMDLMSIEMINKLGFFCAFAICAIGLDLIWGYMGVLSLCQFMFFSLGGYCMGLYLINHGPMDRDGIPMALSYVMSDVSNREPPWFLPLFESFPAAVLLGMLIPGLLGLLIGVTTFRSRVRGVYFAILTQAITVGAWLVFQKNDLKLGGTNGLTNFEQVLGFNIAANEDLGRFQQTRFWMYIASVVVLLVVLGLAKWLVHSPFGKVLIAIRDDETRLRFAGYNTWLYKAAAFTIAAVFAGVAGMLYVPQKGIITPQQMTAFASIIVVIWVALGGRATLWGAVLGAFAVNLLYDFMTSWKPEYWMYVLGGVFILVPLALPGGLMSLPGIVAKLIRGRPGASRPGTPSAAAVTGGGA